MFNRSQIMKAAWVRFRSVRQRYAPWQIARGIVDGSFACALRFAWQDAKREAQKAAALAGPNADRIAAIQAQIADLKYKSFQMNVEPRRMALQRELADLGA